MKPPVNQSVKRTGDTLVVLEKCLLGPPAQRRRLPHRYATKMKKTIILIQSAIIFFSSFSYAEDFSGFWLWEKNSNSHTFSINLIKSKQGYTGTYCAIGMSGNRIDCSAESGNIFKVEKFNKPFKFKTNYSNTGGFAKLIEINNEIIWEMIEEPKGEHYAPKSAKLIKKK